MTPDKSPSAENPPSVTETAEFAGLTITPLGEFVKPEDGSMVESSTLDVRVFAVRKAKVKV